MSEPDAGLGGFGALPRTGGGLATAACARAEHAGLAVAPLLSRIGVDPDWLAASGMRLAVRDQIRILNLLAEELDDDLLGFHLAREGELRNLGLFYYVLHSSDTLEDAARRCARYGAVANEGLAPRLLPKGELGIELRYVGVRRAADRHQAEGWMTAILRIFRQLSGSHLRPRRVTFVHARREPPPELVAYFGVDVEYGAAGDEIAFAPETGAMRVVGADPYLNQVLVRCCEEALARRLPERHSFRAQVENAIVPLLPHAEVRAAEIARRLGLSERTFARRLREEQTTFSALLDRLRLDLAERYLADEALSISQIAWLLGYQEVSAFSKAYRRWTGGSPRSARGVGAKGAKGARGPSSLPERA